MKKYWREYAVLTLLVLNILVWVRVSAEDGSNLLHIYFLNVGQGDSIFIDSPDHKQVLIDGGLDKKVLYELGKIMPFGDRYIDVIIETHPDADHIGGLAPILDNYDVGIFMEPGVKSENKVQKIIENKLKEKGVPKVVARRGMSMDLGGGVSLLILFPNQNVENWETNDASIVAKLTYGDKSFLLTGDSTKKAENILLVHDKNILNSEVLKVGHHGSKTSTSLAYGKVVTPEYAVVSAGKNNRYGHPAPEVLEVLKSVNAQILSTIDLGTIEFETDGQNLVLK